MAIVSSAQFGVADQTDVFDINRDGQITVSWVTSKGSWDGPTPIGSSIFPPKALLAVGQQFGTPNQTDVFGVSKNGKLAVAWVTGKNNWNGPLEIFTADYAPGSSVATSKQFGIDDQTDLFAVNKSGNLTVAWVTGGGQWQGPTNIGSGFVGGKTFVAASQRFGQNRTDVYAVNSSGALTVTSVQGKGTWEPPQNISSPGYFPPGAAIAAGNQFGLPTQTDVFAVDKEGALNVTYYDGSKWNPPRRISQTGVFPPGASVATAQQGPGNQTDVFAVNNQGQLTVSWVTQSGKWDGPQPISDNNFANPGERVAAHPQVGVANQLDVFVADKRGEVQVFWVTSTGSWSGPEPI